MSVKVVQRDENPLARLSQPSRTAPRTKNMPANPATVAGIELRPQLLQRNRVRIVAPGTSRIRTTIGVIPRIFTRIIRIIRHLVHRIQRRKKRLHIHRTLHPAPESASRPPPDLRNRRIRPVPALQAPHIPPVPRQHIPAAPRASPENSHNRLPLFSSLSMCSSHE